MIALAQQTRDFDWGQLLLVFVFIVFPLLARLFKWLGEKVKGPGAPDADGEDPLARRRRLREERRRAEAEGEDLWRRLARGEAPQTPTAAPVPFPGPVRRAGTEGDDVRELSLEEEVEPEPLSMMGRVEEPGEAPELSLERAEEPAPLAAMVARATPATPATPAAPAVPGAWSSPRLPMSLGHLSHGELRRAIVLNEILGRPVSERPLGA